MSALPIFPGRRQPSIFGASELNCRVRNGNGWTLTAISTDYSIPQNLASMDKPTRCLSMETKKQRRERAFTLAWKRAIHSLLLSGDPYESRTRVCGVRGRRLNHLTNGPSSSQSPLHFLQTPVCRPLRSLAPPLPSKPASLSFTWVPKGTLCAPSKLNNVIRKQPAFPLVVTLRLFATLPFPSSRTQNRIFRFLVFRPRSGPGSLLTTPSRFL